jgi:hypothetical protein
VSTRLFLAKIAGYKIIGTCLLPEKWFYCIVFTVDGTTAKHAGLSSHQQNPALKASPYPPSRQLVYRRGYKRKPLDINEWIMCKQQEEEMKLEDWLFSETDDTCAICGIRGMQILTVHHIDGDHLNNVYDNTIILWICRRRYHLTGIRQLSR